MVFHRTRLVRRQRIEDQVQRLFASIQQPVEQDQNDFPGKLPSWMANQNAPLALAADATLSLCRRAGICTAGVCPFTPQIGKI